MKDRSDKMKTIKITYDFFGIVKTYITNDPKDY